VGLLKPQRWPVVTLVAIAVRTRVEEVRVERSQFCCKLSGLIVVDVEDPGRARVVMSTTVNATAIKLQAERGLVAGVILVRTTWTRVLRSTVTRTRIRKWVSQPILQSQVLQ
jgi:hypothetical protein